MEDITSVEVVSLKDSFPKAGKHLPLPPKTCFFPSNTLGAEAGQLSIMWLSVQDTFTTLVRLMNVYHLGRLLRRYYSPPAI
jgi:hypothetical protein